MFLLVRFGYNGIQNRDFLWHRERSTAVNFSGQSGLILSAILFPERDVGQTRKTETDRI